MKNLLESVQKNQSRGIENISLKSKVATLSKYVMPRELVLTAIGCSWLLMVLLANPSGEFPLNDDWSYARAVQMLVQNGRLELTGFTSMPLIAQVFWGALFCIPFGFSFTALRISTITLGLLGILTTYWIFRELKIEHNLALFATAVLALNPLYFQLSLSFMTDVPFFAFSMLAFLFFLRALRTENPWHILAGYIFSFFAILIRQLAITIPLSFLIAYFVKNRVSRRTLLHGFLPNGVFASFLFAFPFILRRTIGLPVLYNRSYEPILESTPMGWVQLPLVFADRMLIVLLYLGLFLLPFLIGLGITTGPLSKLPARRVSLFAWSTVFFVLSVYLIWKPRLMPLTGNMVFNLGLGPLLLRDTYLLRLPDWPTAPTTFWMIVTVAAALGGVLLFRHVSSLSLKIFRTLPSKFDVKHIDILFLLSAVVLYSIFVGLAGFLDRYLIWLLPLLMAVISISLPSVRWFSSTVSLIAASALIILYAFFAFAGTHDYMAWNRSRWHALTDLIMKDHMSYQNIDGGFEFNGWYGYDSRFQPAPTKSWWWVRDDQYVISFGSIPGYVAIRQYSFNRWIPLGQGNIFVLKRADAQIGTLTK